MSNTVARRLVALPGAIERGTDVPPTPDEALRRLLAAHVHAPSLLSEARHRAVLARNSVGAAAQAARVARDAELAHELARRKSDPRGSRNLGFWPARAALTALLLVCGGTGLLLAQGLRWPDRIMLAVATSVLAAMAAWGVGIRRGKDQAVSGFLAAGLAMCVLLVTMRILTAGGAVVLRAAVAVSLGIVLCAAVSLAVLALEHAESWHCFRLRRAARRAVAERADSAALVSRDEADAAAAAAAWESLVVEECRLAHPGGVAEETWVEECLDVARQAATPA